MTWLAQPMLAFDTETTGTDPTEARIVTATTVRIVGSETTAQSWLINPGVPIPDEAAAIHGVTTEKATADGADPADALQRIALAVGGAFKMAIPVIGHNVGFDLTILDCDLRRHDLPPLTEWAGGPLRPVLDTLCIDRGVDRYRRGKRTLEAACQHYKVRLDAAHDATEDALAAARVLWRMAKEYNLVALSLDELHDEQAKWHRTWAEGFQSYLAGKGSDEVISADWPIRGLAVTA